MPNRKERRAAQRHAARLVRDASDVDVAEIRFGDEGISGTFWHGGERTIAHDGDEVSQMASTLLNRNIKFEQDRGTEDG